MMKFVAAVLCVTVFLRACAAPVELLCADPGQDCSSQIRFSCHTHDPNCFILCTDASDARFSHARRIRCKAIDTPERYNGAKGYVKCTAEFDRLRPGTKYIYKAVTGSGDQSAVQSFRTAPVDGRFSFLWMGDVHSTPSTPQKMKSVEKLVASAEIAAAHSGISFVLFSGDAVKRGTMYSHWREWNGSPATADHMFAAIPGNKEYYAEKGKTRHHNRWFCAAHNNPPNGAPGLESSYWFIYGGVLFIAVDSLAPEGKELDQTVRREATRRQQAWFERTVMEQKGCYQYLVVFQHYPYFKKDSPCDWGGYEKWSALFDRHGVDLALSGDSHSYVRSHPVADGKVRDGGTVYMVCPEIDKHLSAPKIRKGEGLVAAYDERGSSYGACVIDVDRRAMTIRYILDGSEAFDSVTIKARRPPPMTRRPTPTR